MKRFSAPLKLPLLILWGIVYAFPVIAKDCKFSQVTFSADFNGGRLDGCEQLSENHFLLTTDAENRPINPSPWYAFSVVPTESFSSKTIKISVQAVDAKARYLPKMSFDKQTWQPLDFEMLDNTLIFDLPLTKQVYIAGQELIDNEYYTHWMKGLAEQTRFEQIPIGTSVQQRPISALIAQQPDNNEWLLILGRQHPPEITGAQALVAFVKELAESGPLQQSFFARFNLMIVPNVNPDGVALGNWRHNTEGVDLNRDWGKFTQPETRAVKQRLDTILNDGQRLVFALDFHSTQQDIFYTMPSDYSVAPEDFVEQWLKQLKISTVSSFVVRPKPGTSPGRGVFKQFVADTYNVHAVTFEIGDNTDRKLIKHVAAQSARTLMTQMLKTNKDKFIFEMAPEMPEDLPEGVN